MSQKRMMQSGDGNIEQALLDESNSKSLTKIFCMQGVSSDLQFSNKRTAVSTFESPQVRHVGPSPNNALSQSQGSSQRGQIGDGLSLRNQLDKFRDVAQVGQKDLDKIMKRVGSKSAEPSKLHQE